MRLNSTDLGLVEAFGMLSDLKHLSSLVEASLSENLQLEHFAIENSCYPDEVIRDAEKWALNEFREKAFGSYLRYGLVLLIYSTIESQLNFTISVFLKRHKIGTSRIRRKKNESNLELCKRKLDQFEIDPPIRWTDFEILNGLMREVRNCIAHDGGVVNPRLQKKLSASLGLLEVNSEKRLFVQSMFIDQMLSAAQSLFTHLSLDLGFLVKNQKKFIRIASHRN